MRTLLCALGLSWGAMAYCAGAYVTDATTSVDPYNFGTAATTLSLLTTAYPEWSVYNVEDASVYAALALGVVIDTDTAGGTATTYLNFADNTISEDLGFLELALRDSTDTDNPISLTATQNAATSTYRTDSIYVEMLPVQSESLPSIDDLLTLYATTDVDVEASAYPVAAKVAIAVSPTGYICVSRTTFDSTDGGEATADSAQFEWCNTGVSYAASDGRVLLRIEVVTYPYEVATDDYVYARAYRLWLQKWDTTSSAWGTEVCLTEGLGFSWMNDEDNYYIDFTTAGDWFFFMDETVTAANPTSYTTDPLDTLQALGFSATDGRLYSVWMAANQTTTNTSAVASAYSATVLGSFASYVSGSSLLGTASEATTLLEQWMARYNVDLTQYLDDDTATVATFSTLSTTDTTSTTGKTEAAYEAFLLNMDPADDAAHVLTITGIVPEEAQVTITVQGPTGYKLTNLEAAEVVIRRAATLDTLESGTTTAYTATANSDGSLTFVMPRTVDAEELPFMRAELSALTFSDSSTETTE